MDIETLENRCLFAVSPVLLNSWFLAGQGQNAQAISGYNVAAGPSATWPTNVPPGANYSGGNTTPALGDIQKVSYSDNYVYVNTPDFASYVMGPWFNPNGQVFMNFPANQNQIVRIREGAYPSAVHPQTTGGAVGIGVNGVAIYNNGDAFSYDTSAGVDASNMNGGDRLWNRQAEFAEKPTFDHANAHQPGNGQYHYHVTPTALRAQLNDNIDYVGSTNYFPYDPQVYLTHGQGTDGKYVERTTNLHHSPIIGWMYDGHPIYGPYGYSNPTDANSTIRRIDSGFRLRNITDRTSLPGWAAQIAPINANVPPESTYALTATQYGPAVTTTYPLGRYGEDYEFVPGGDLDQFNGRFTVTPEFPQGVYAYFITIDSVGAPAFPYILGRQYYGPVNSGRVTVTTGDGTVNVLFDVSVNTAPVISGVNAVTVQTGNAFPFSSANLVSIYDIDAATNESITFTVTAGTLSVDLSGALASGCTITSGANGSSSFTLRGGISHLNAALPTLTYTAPNTGTTATLTIQANDGSAANNLSNTITTTITLTTPVIPTIANRAVFYNNASGFGTSGVNNAPTVNPVNAIDPTKVALLPGQTTTTTNNYTNYSRGLNGLVVDIDKPTNLAAIGAASFQFATWNNFAIDITPNFVTINPTVTVSTFAAGGANGTDRVKLVFNDTEIQNAWLRVTVLADAFTGLPANDVFYFGHARNDVTPTSAFPAQVTVNIFDTNVVRAGQGTNAGIVSSRTDVDKNGITNIFDVNAIRVGQGVSSLRPFSAPALLSFGLLSSSSATSQETNKLSVSLADDYFAAVGTDQSTRRNRRTRPT